MLRTLFWFSEVATGKLLDLAEGANATLTHSGTKQTQSDPFTVHNHATENNNTVWVRREKGWSVRFSCFSLIRLPCWKWWLSVRVMYCTCCIQRSVFYSRAAAVMKHTIAYWTERALSHNWRGCGAANSITQPPESIEETLCMLMYNKKGLLSPHKTKTLNLTGVCVCVCFFCVAGVGGRSGRGFLKVRRWVNLGFPWSSGSNELLFWDQESVVWAALVVNTASPSAWLTPAQFTGPDSADTLPESCCLSRLWLPHTDFLRGGKRRLIAWYLYPKLNEDVVICSIGKSFCPHSW